MYYVIKPLGGFGNRIRVVFSYLIYCLQNNKKLYVIWKKDDACNGYYLDYFSPIYNVNFSKEAKLKVNYKGEFPYKCSKSDYLHALKLLIPLPWLKKEIDSKKCGNYNAFHIRRTDHVKLAQRHHSFTTDNDFYHFIENSQLPVYGAFDNLNTQNQFLQKYPNLKYNILIPQSGKKRHTKLKDAIIDIFVCTDADVFFPSGYSSFSDLINNLRKIHAK